MKIQVHLILFLLIQTTQGDGSHTITAIATDSANQVVSTSINITVNNASLPSLACSDGFDNDSERFD